MDVAPFAVVGSWPSHGLPWPAWQAVARTPEPLRARDRVGMSDGWDYVVRMNFEGELLR